MAPISNKSTIMYYNRTVFVMSVSYEFMVRVLVLQPLIALTGKRHVFCFEKVELTGLQVYFVLTS